MGILSLGNQLNSVAVALIEQVTVLVFVQLFPRSGLGPVGRQFRNKYKANNKQRN